MTIGQDKAHGLIASLKMRFEEFVDAYTTNVYAEFGSFGEGPLALDQILYKEALYSYVEHAI